MENGYDESDQNAPVIDGAFRAAFEYSSAPMAILDLSVNQILSVNKAILEFSHYRRAELEGSSLACLKILTDQKDREAFYEALQHSSQVDDFMARIVDLGGKEKFVSINIRPMLSGSQKWCVLVLTDITQRRRAQDNLLQKEERLRLALEGGRLGLWDYFPASNYFAYDSNWLDIQNMSPGSMPNHMDAVMARIHPDDLLRAQNVLELVQAGKRDFIDLTFRTRYGEGSDSWIWITVRGKVSEEQLGQAVRITGVIQNVTERHQAMECLIRSEAQTKLAGQMANLGYWEAYPQNHELYLSEVLCQIIGLDVSAERIPTKSIEHLVFEEDRQLMKEEFANSIKEDRSFAVEVRIHAVRGEALLQFRAVHIKNDQGRYRYSVGIALDITEIRKAEVALVKSERRFRALYENMNEMVVLHSMVFDDRGNPVDYRIISSNQAFERVTGISRADAEGKLASEIYHETPPPYLDRYSLVATTGEPDLFESHYAAMDKHFIISVISPGKNTFATITMDVSAQKEAEQTARLSHFVLDNSELPVAFLRSDGSVVYANQAMRVLLNVDEVSKVKYYTMDAHYANSDFSEFWQLLRKEHVVRYSSYLVPQGSESEIPIEVISSYLEQNSEEICCIYVQDVSERLVAREQREELERRLRLSQKMEAVGRLAGGIAHDFNNLLHVILGYSELLQETATSESEEYVREITKAGRRAMSLIGQLLAFSRRESEVSENIQINDLIHDTMGLLRRVIGEEIEVNLDINSLLPPVCASYSQVEQILLNLCLNAREAMPEGGAIHLVTSSTMVGPEEAEAKRVGEGNYVTLVFSDTGKGMSREMSEHVFEPFFTTKAVGQGSGLGLATVYAIIRKMNGYIDVQSEPQKGTTFFIGLPASSG